MEFLSLGGIGEHGRNCFLLRGERHTLMLDCGKGEQGELPDFRDVDIGRIDALLFSHSHIDHTGAIMELVRLGFHGQVFSSRDTYVMLDRKMENVTFFFPGRRTEILDGVFVLPAKSGHCFGGLSLEIQMEGKTILYTGDYIEDSVFSVDPIRGRRDDLAIVDAAYSEERDYMENRTEFLSLLHRLQGNVLLPLPKNGRSMDVLSLLYENGIRYSVLGEGFYFGDEAYLRKKIIYHPEEDARIHLMTDPQLNLPSSKEILEEEKDSNLVFTGTIDEKSYAFDLMEHRKKTYFSRINVHQTYRQARRLIQENDFRNIVLFHNPKLPGKKRLQF